MNRRLVIKTVLVCTGVFLIFAALIYYYVASEFRIVRDKEVCVVAASTAVDQGAVLTEAMLEYRDIPAEYATPGMLSSFSSVCGKKAVNAIPAGEYIRAGELLPEQEWYGKDDRRIVLPLERENTLAYAVEKGSCIDIRVWDQDRSGLPELVLSKVFVEDIIDEGGFSMKRVFGNKKAYLVLILTQKERNRLYDAMPKGKLLYELYCSKLQKAAR